MTHVIIIERCLQLASNTNIERHDVVRLVLKISRTFILNVDTQQCYEKNGDKTIGQ